MLTCTFVTNHSKIVLHADITSLILTEWITLAEDRTIIGMKNAEHRQQTQKTSILLLSDQSLSIASLVKTA